MQLTSRSSFTNRNEVRLVRSGHEFFDLLEQLIGKARHYIHLQTYIFANDETGARIAKALIQAAQKNIRIFLVIDGYASQDLPDSFIRKLTDAGVTFRWFDPLLKSRYFYLGRRLHHKVLVVDGEYGMVGGINISDHYNHTTHATAWLDYAVYVRGEAIAQLQTVCERRTVLSGGLFRKKKLLPAIDTNNWPAPAECYVGVRINDWVKRKGEITNAYVRMLNQAESRVIILSPYFIPGSLFMQALLRAARRGVKIQLILAGVSDVMLAKSAERYIYSRLFQKNIEIYEYQKKVLHGKISTCDDQWVTVGSYNINNISSYASIELNLEIQSTEFAKKLSSELSDIIQHDCKLITKDFYNAKVNFIRRIKLRIAYDIFRLLFFVFTFYFRQHRE
ncbi:MAG: cardiolipin synthase ClsB [Flammeovirgaceae bacterium]|nr:cardiolipin synthase ClsB [Flammeovirgaceae bacterium]